MARRIVHLFRESSLGGVTRFRRFLENSESVRALGPQEIIISAGGLSRPPRVAADVIVSHMVLNRRNLPFFVALRILNPKATLIHVEHGYCETLVNSEIGNLGRFRLLFRSLLYLFDRVVTINRAQDTWLKQFAGLDADKTHLIRPCVSLDEFLALQAPRGDVRRIGAIGRLAPEKGFDRLVQAFRGIDRPDASLEIFGQGIEHERLLKLAEGDSRIVFHGHSVDPTQPMAAVDAVAIPSRWETYGLVALEAMAAMRPVLVSPFEGLLDHAEAGACLVPQSNVEGWRKALTDLFDGAYPGNVLKAHAHAECAEAQFVSGWRELLDDLQMAPRKASDRVGGEARHQRA